MRFVYGLAVVIVCSTFAFGQAGSNTSGTASEDEQELRKLVKRWHEASNSGDAGTLANILADEFSYVGGWGKSEYVEAVRAGKIGRFTSVDVTEVQIQIYGDVAIVSVLTSYKMKGSARGDSPESYIMSAWVKRDGRWQSVKACLREKHVPIPVIAPR